MRSFVRHSLSAVLAQADHVGVWPALVAGRALGECCLRCGLAGVVCVCVMIGLTWSIPSRRQARLACAWPGSTVSTYATIQPAAVFYFSHGNPAVSPHVFECGC